MNLKALINSLLRRPLHQMGIHICRTHRFPVCYGSMLNLAVPAFLPKFNNFKICQIGASDGQTSDPLAHLIEHYDLSGILIEPLPNAFQLLSQKYTDNPKITCLNCAVSHTDGTVDFYRPKNEGRLGISDFQKSGLSKAALVGVGIADEQIEKIDVESKTLETIIKENDIEKIHLLQIDTEGFDYEIVKLALKLASPPPIIHFESIHLSRSDKEESRRILTEQAYSLIESETDTLAFQNL